MSTSLETPFSLFDPEECRALIERARRLEQRPGRVMGPDPLRQSRNNWTYWLELSQPEYDRIWDLSQPWQQSLNLTWMQKPIQISRYGQGEYYDWHRDVYGAEGRKSVRALTLTCTLQTAPGATFETESGCYDLAEGQAVFMLANTLHKAHAPTEGERWSFTVWYMRPNHLV